MNTAIAGFILVGMGIVGVVLAISLKVRVVKLAPIWGYSMRGILFTATGILLYGTGKLLNVIGPDWASTLCTVSGVALFIGGIVLQWRDRAQHSIHQQSGKDID